MEWRWKNPEFYLQCINIEIFPNLYGMVNKDINDKRIMIWCEQGIGDTLNWSSCLPLVTLELSTVYWNVRTN